MTAVSAKLSGTDIPFLDLGQALLKDHTPAEVESILARVGLQRTEYQFECLVHNVGVMAS